MDKITVNGKEITSKTDIVKNKISRDDLCLALLVITKKKNIVGWYANSFKNNNLLNQDFSIEDIMSINCEATVKTLNAWENYVARENNKKPKHKIKLNSNTKLKTFGQLTGYHINSLKNSLNKLYNRLTAEKRMGSIRGMVYLDGNAVNGEKSNFDMFNAYNPFDMKDYKQTLLDMHEFLVERDTKNNTEMAKLFSAMLDSSFKGNFDEIRHLFSWSEHYFKKNRKELTEVLRKKYSDIGLDLLREAVKFNTDNSDLRLKNEKEVKYDIRTVYQMKQKKKPIYQVESSLGRVVDGKWQEIKKKVKRLDDQASSFEEAKTKLKILNERNLVLLNKELNMLKAKL